MNMNTQICACLLFLYFFPSEIVFKIITLYSVLEKAKLAMTNYYSSSSTENRMGVL